MSTHRFYTKSEDDFIRQHYLSMLVRDIGKHLGRGKRSVQHRMSRLGLQKQTLRRWNSEEDEVIRSNINRGLVEVSRLLGRHPSEVSSRARKIGLSFQKRARYTHKDGYEYIRFTNDRGERETIWTHIKVVEESIGRRVVKPECVHHINMDKSDNRIENLYLCPNISVHKLVHTSIDKLVPILLERGIIRFDNIEGVYKICENDQ